MALYPTLLGAEFYTHMLAFQASNTGSGCSWNLGHTDTPHAPTHLIALQRSNTVLQARLAGLQA